MGRRRGGGRERRGCRGVGGCIFGFRESGLGESTFVDSDHGGATGGTAEGQGEGDGQTLVLEVLEAHARVAFRRVGGGRGVGEGRRVGVGTGGKQAATHVDGMVPAMPHVARGVLCFGRLGVRFMWAAQFPFKDALHQRAMRTSPRGLGVGG